MLETILYISTHLTEAEKWGQLAEECTELAQAALKMQRQCMDNNKPRCDLAECEESVIEEHADVVNCFKVLGWNDKNDRELIGAEKLNRWANSISARLANQRCH